MRAVTIWSGRGQRPGSRRVFVNPHHGGLCPHIPTSWTSSWRGKSLPSSHGRFDSGSPLHFRNFPMIKIGTAVSYREYGQTCTGTVTRTSTRTGAKLYRVNDRWFERIALDA